jgi:hypothetical protein
MLAGLRRTLNFLKAAATSSGISQVRADYRRKKHTKEARHEGRTEEQTERTATQNGGRGLGGYTQKEGGRLNKPYCCGVVDVLVQSNHCVCVCVCVCVWGRYQ